MINKRKRKKVGMGSWLLKLLSRDNQKQKLRIIKNSRKIKAMGNVLMF